METKTAADIKWLALCVILPLIIGFIGSAFTTPAIPSWYSSLQKPAFSPPNWIFGPVWTILYILMGVSLYLARKNRNGLSKKSAFLFGAQLFLNLLWSAIFFGLQSPLFAFAEIILLWIAIVFTIIEFGKVSSSAALLLIPYLLWVSFAAVLNYYVWVLNA